MRRLQRSALATAVLFLVGCSDGILLPEGIPTAESHKPGHGGGGGGSGGSGGSPKFHYVNYAVDNPSGVLSASFKQTGLGNFQTVDYLLQSNVVATVQCYNKGGNRPQGAPHNIGPVQVEADGSFKVRSGQVTGSISVGLGELNPCKAGGHVAVLTAVTWSATMLFWGNSQLAAHSDLTPDLGYPDLPTAYSATDLD